MSEPYKNREQTEAKHFILKRYLQVLAYKILSFQDELVFIDGFSGPWKSTTEDFGDTSFMIAIRVLQEAQEHYRSKGQRKTVKCLFVEKDADAFAKLDPAVKYYHDPGRGFHVATFCGPFEDSVPFAKSYISTSFSLTFIDPTGWTGFAYDKIKPLLQHSRGEVLINLMYDFINRFTTDPRPHIEQSFDGILGGAGWKERLDTVLPPGDAVLKLSVKELKASGGFQYVVKTAIDKVTADRPHFCLVYGTRNSKGLRAFRQVEWDALRKHQTTRQQISIENAEAKSNQPSFFDATDLPNAIELEVLETMKVAKAAVVEKLGLNGSSLPFGKVCDEILQEFRLRETNVKTLCKELADEGFLESPWKSSNRQKPNDADLLSLRSSQ